MSSDTLSDGVEQSDTATIELDPDDMGTSTVQENGTLYVGREHADKDVRWVIEDRNQ